jgi:hypothetical protein
MRDLIKKYQQKLELLQSAIDNEEKNNINSRDLYHMIVRKDLLREVIQDLESQL